MLKTPGLCKKPSCHHYLALYADGFVGCPPNCRYYVWQLATRRDPAVIHVDENTRQAYRAQNRPIAVRPLRTLDVLGPALYAKFCEMYPKGGPAA